MVLADCSVWADDFNGAPTPVCDGLDTVLGTEHFAIGDVIPTDVLRGFRTESSYRKTRE